MSDKSSNSGTTEYAILNEAGEGGQDFRKYGT